jgi:hypothetical protein
VLVPLVLVLLLGVSLRTWLVTLSQHFTVPEEAALGEGVVDVWAAAIPIPPASIAAAISPILVIRMRRTLLVADESRRPLAVTYGNRSRRSPVPHQSRDKKGPPLPGGAQ